MSNNTPTPTDSIAALKALLDTIPTRHSQTLTKLAELDKAAAAWETSMKEQTTGTYSPEAVYRPEMIEIRTPDDNHTIRVTKEYILSQEIDAEIAALRADTEKIKAADMVALYAAEGCSAGSAVEKAKEHVKQLIEGWVDLLCRAKFAEAGDFKGIEDLGHPVELREYIEHAEALDEQWEVLVKRAKEEIADTRAAAEKYFPYCTTEKSRKQCVRLVVGSNFAARFAVAMMRRVLAGLNDHRLAHLVVQGHELQGRYGTTPPSLEWVRMKLAQMNFEAEKLELECEEVRKVVEPFEEMFEKMVEAEGEKGKGKVKEERDDKEGEKKAHDEQGKDDNAGGDKGYWAI
jgi:hypothetical protein